MASPVYKGSNQPTASSGWLAGLASWFGGSAPVYAGVGQSTQGSSGFLGGATPAYKPAPAFGDGTQSVAGSAAVCPVEPERITVLIPRDLIGPQE